MPLDYSQHYARFHPADPAHRHGLTLYHHRVLGPLLPASRDASILDVGCASGHVLEDLRALGYRSLAGIEPNATLAAAARERGLAVETVGDTVAHLRPQAGRYDVVLLLDVLEHVPRDAQPDFLAAIAASLRPGGRLLCAVPNASSAIGSHWHYNDYTHRVSFTSDSLGFLLGQSGFASVRITGPEFFPRPRFLFWLPLPRSLAWWCRVCTRLRLRLAYIGELGWARGRQVVLTPNLLAVADRTG